MKIISSKTILKMRNKSMQNCLKSKELEICFGKRVVDIEIKCESNKWKSIFDIENNFEKRRRDRVE